MTSFPVFQRRTVTALMALGLMLTGIAVQAAAGAEPVPEPVVALQQHWAHANYETEGKARKQAFKALTVEADQLVQALPEQADAHIWAGIVYSTYAGEVSMFSAGKQVKRARAELARALEINPEAMHGSAYTSLGALLYQIPGFMGGDDEEAETLLLKGLSLNPDGIDANYFYASFLIDQHRDDEARPYLEKALQAPDRPGRPVADAGRRAEVLKALKEIGGTS